MTSTVCIYTYDIPGIMYIKRDIMCIYIYIYYVYQAWAGLFTGLSVRLYRAL